MAEAPPLTRDLAVRLERLIGDGALKEAGKSGPDGLTAAQFGSTVAVKTKTGRPRNNVFCFGQEDIRRLEEILAYYAADALEPRFFLAPMGFTREVAVALSAAGFGQYDYEQAILYGVPDLPVAPPQGVSIELVTSENREEFVQATADGFEWPMAWREAAMDGVRSGFTNAGYRFLARYQGEAAGAAALFTDEDGVARLSGGAVVPKLRRKGCHLALVRSRLAVAQELGCTLVVGGSTFNSSSFRNQQRAGLRLGYVECEWRRLAATPYATPQSG